MDNQIKLSKEKLRIEIDELEATLIKNKEEMDLVVGDSDRFPLKHTFIDGLYIREIALCQGTLAIGKLQKNEHLWVLLKGKLTVTTMSGTEDYIAPCYVKAAAGEKKVVYAHEDCVFMNVYPNKNNITDLDHIESLWIAKDYIEYEKFKQLKE